MSAGSHAPHFSAHTIGRSIHTHLRIRWNLFHIPLRFSTPARPHVHSVHSSPLSDHRLNRNAGTIPAVPLFARLLPGSNNPLKPYPLGFNSLNSIRSDVIHGHGHLPATPEIAGSQKQLASAEIGTKHADFFELTMGEKCSVHYRPAYHHLGPYRRSSCRNWIRSPRVNLPISLNASEVVRFWQAQRLTRCLHAPASFSHPARYTDRLLAHAAGLETVPHEAPSS